MHSIPLISVHKSTSHPHSFNNQLHLLLVRSTLIMSQPAAVLHRSEPEAARSKYHMDQLKRRLCPSCELMCWDWKGLMSGLGDHGPLSSRSGRWWDFLYAYVVSPAPLNLSVLRRGRRGAGHYNIHKGQSANDRLLSVSACWRGARHMNVKGHGAGACLCQDHVILCWLLRPLLKQEVFHISHLAH